MAELLKLLASNGLPVGVGLMVALMYLTDRQSRRARETTASLMEWFKESHEAQSMDLRDCREENARKEAVIRELVARIHKLENRGHP